MLEVLDLKIGGDRWSNLVSTFLFASTRSEIEPNNVSLANFDSKIKDEAILKFNKKWYA